MKFSAVISLVLMSLLCTPLAAEPLITEVIPTRRNAAELVQVLRPLVPAPGSINSFRNQLVIKASAAEMVEIRAVLKKLDKALENLLISVRFSVDAEVRRDLARAHARISKGNVAANIQVQRSLATRTGNEIHSLRVLSGQRAFIHTGQSVPVADDQVTVTGTGVSTSRGIHFEEFGSGFYVLANLVDNQVILEINPRKRQLDGQSNAINSAQIQQAVTQISGQLGRWMEVAGVDSAAHRRALGSATSRFRSTHNDSSIFVKVERLGF